MKNKTLAIGLAVFMAACASSPEQAPAPSPAPAPKQSLPVTPPPAAAAPAPAAPKRCDASVTLQKDETFAFDRYVLTEAAKRRLDTDVIGKLGGCASVEAVVIEGHADRLGSQQYNQKLSERRAESVKADLVGSARARTAPRSRLSAWARRCRRSSARTSRTARS